MNEHIIICAMCGHIFDPTLHTACQQCPLQKSCNLVCCPHCGYEMVDIHQSKWARFAARLLPKGQTTTTDSLSTLAEIPAGRQAKVVKLGNTLPADLQVHLQAYGLAPGRKVRVVQHSPVTIVQIDHTELALETDMAQAIQVVLS